MSRLEGLAPVAFGEVMTNLFADLPAHPPVELFTPLLEAGTVRVERIVSHGHASPAGFWYDQARPEWVVLLAGAARLRFEGEESPVELRPGDHLAIPAHQRHRVEWTTPDEPTVWLTEREIAAAAERLLNLAA